MDIQKEEFIKRFKSTFIYDLLSETLTDEQLFEHIVDPVQGIVWFKNQTRQMWFMWQQAQKVAVPDGWVVVPREPTEDMYLELSRHLCRYMQMKDRYCPKTLGNYLERFVGLKNIPQWLHDEVKNWESDHAFATADMGVFIYKAMIEAVNQPV